MIKFKHLTSINYFVYIILFFFLFLIFAWLNPILKERLSYETVIAILGAIITVFITSLLIKGQAKSDELKERNVKVFEKKTEKFDNFIEKIWEFWEDKKITREELEELVKIVCKDILIFTEDGEGQEILKSLIEISKFTPNEVNTEYRNNVRNAIFKIINILAKNIGLKEGGCGISDGEQEKLEELINKIDKIKIKEAEKKAETEKLIE